MGQHTGYKMSSPSDLDSAMIIHCLLAGLYTDFTQTLENLKQVSLLLQEERVKMEHWREVSLSSTFITINDRPRQHPINSCETQRPQKTDQLSLSPPQQQQQQQHQTHNLPSYLAPRGTLASTPPMSLPFLDHHLQSLDQTIATPYTDTDQHSLFSGVPSWPSGSSSSLSSPFRQTFHQ